MEEKTIVRIGIVASIVGAVGAIAYILSKPPAAGPAGPPGASGLPGETGGPGLAAAATSTAGAGVPGAAATPPPTPSGQSLTQYFVSQFFPAAAAAPSTAITSNVPPSWDLTKRTTPSGKVNGGGAGNGHCGCSGGLGGACGGACGSGRCPNQPAALNFPDGAGACAATTVGRLQVGMDKCQPGNLSDAALNMVGNTQSWSDSPDFALFQQSVEHSLASIPGAVPTAKFSSTPNAVPPSRFGAS